MKQYLYVSGCGRSWVELLAQEASEHIMEFGCGPLVKVRIDTDDDWPPLDFEVMHKEQDSD